MHISLMFSMRETTPWQETNALGCIMGKTCGPKCPMALLVLAVLRPYLFEASRVSCLGLLSLFCQWHRMRKKSVDRQAKREKEERGALIFFFEELAMSMQSRQKPDRPWHNFRASKPVARFSGTRYISLISRFWGSKILEWPVGTRLSRNKRERGEHSEMRRDSVRRISRRNLLRRDSACRISRPNLLRRDSVRRISWPLPDQIWSQIPEDFIFSVVSTFSPEESAVQNKHISHLFYG